jgi:hypothetical protein
VKRKRRKVPTPKRLQKTVLTLAQAADQFERADDELIALAKRVKKAEAQRDEAEERLLDHFEKTGRAAYKDRIGWMWTRGSWILDQDKITKFLGEALPHFQTRTKSRRKLTRLTEPDSVKLLK